MRMKAELESAKWFKGQENECFFYNVGRLAELVKLKKVEKEALPRVKYILARPELEGLDLKAVFFSDKLLDLFYDQSLLDNWEKPLFVDEDENEIGLEEDDEDEDDEDDEDQDQDEESKS